MRCAKIWIDRQTDRHKDRHEILEKCVLLEFEFGWISNSKIYFYVMMGESFEKKNNDDKFAKE